VICHPGKAGPEVGSASTHGRECDRLPSLERLVLLHFGIKVQNVDESRLLAGKDGTDLRLEQTQLSVMDGARAINGDADFAVSVTRWPSGQA
jgi:hypothetical protein